MTESADIERIGIWAIDQAIKQRIAFGHPYANRELESKRRSAILYLRSTERGWVCDRIVKRWGK
jgi:hypothetical protein